MENSSLNKAHQQRRRAETHLRRGRFDEAAECHAAAADLLSEALSRASDPRALESLRLQRDFHLRQRAVVEVRREQLEGWRRALEGRRRRSGAKGEAEEGETEEGGGSLQAAIYRTMEETDSLLLGLLKRNSAANTNSDSESIRSFSTTDTDDCRAMDIIDCPNAAALLGSKHPKDDSTVIEELRILNGQLHSLVFQLVTQLDARVKEVDKLKETIKQLESEKGKVQNKNSNGLKVITDSSGGTSPYVFSPCSELSPDVHDTRVLPALAPLELPNFDLTSFVKNTSNQVNTTN